jgi:tetratricopeptide (TPR) repeat protein
MPTLASAQSPWQISGGTFLMYSFAQASIRILAAAAFAAVGLAQLPTLAQAPSDKPQNSLEIKAPGKGEEKAYKAFQHFQSLPESDAAKKVAAGEDFLNKFPTSTYAAYVYSYLTVAYIQAGQVDKGISTGEKAIQMNPSDFRTMAVLSQTLSRTVTETTPDAASKLARAETDAKGAIAGVATWVKPDAMPDATFTTLKNGTLVMAHASLGLIALHKNNFEAAVPELEQAVQIGAADSTNTDPTNYYLLGVAQQNSGHPDKAIPNFEKCAAVKGTNLTATCVALLDQSKKEAQTKP